MEFKKWMKSLLMMALVFGLVACDDDDDEEESTPYDDLAGTLIKSDQTWGPGTIQRSGKYFVLPGVTLTIAAGTTVQFAYHNNDPDAVGAIITLRGDGENPSGQLIANGTSTNPIVLTSAQTTKASGDWGGVILIGEGSTNVGGATQVDGDVEGLPDVVKYGGTNNADNSGSMQYVRIEFCGFGIAADSEINGLSFYAVGSGTTINHVQVHKCTDDGYEWFGGAVDAHYLISSYNDDDSFDMDEGWNGDGQFWLAVQASGADNGFESDGRKVLGAGSPTSPTLSNVTLYGFGAGKDDDDNNSGMRLREELNGDFRNFVVANFAGPNLRLDAKSQVNDGSLKLTYMTFYNNSLDDSVDMADNQGYRDAEQDSIMSVASRNNKVETVTFNNASSKDFRVTNTISAGTTVPTGFTTASYRGAFGGATSTNWASGSWVAYN